MPVTINCVIITFTSIVSSVFSKAIFVTGKGSKGGILNTGIPEKIKQSYKTIFQDHEILMRFLWVLKRIRSFFVVFIYIFFK